MPATATTSAAATGSFTYNDAELRYAEYGSGDRLLVLTHGLLMNRHMYDRLGPKMASAGNRVICLDLLGHGDSDKPLDKRQYSMTAFAHQIAALLDHLGAEEAIVGGTSLGANVALEFASRHGDRTKGLFVEMPVLDNSLVAVAAIFTPLMVGLRFGAPGVRLVSRLTSRIPRTSFLVDIALDWARRDPGPSLAVLEGLLLGRTCPPSDERMGFDQPALVIGHPSDPLHPFSDADMLTREMDNAELVDANSILEWRLRPQRLNRELAAFLDRVWST